MTVKETFTQDDLHLIIPSKIARTVDLLSEKTGEDPVELMTKFYASDVYAKLRDESTKYWWFGPAELSELYLQESGLRRERQDGRDDGEGDLGQRRGVVVVWHRRD